MNNVNSLNANIENVATLIRDIDIAIDSNDIENVDTQVVDWFEQRFRMFVEDGCAGAIVEYLKLLRNANYNTTTCLHIMELATMYLCNNTSLL